MDGSHLPRDSYYNVRKKDEQSAIRYFIVHSWIVTNIMLFGLNLWCVN